MPRTRQIKYGFFINEFLAQQSVQARLVFIGLWTLADREGRLEDRPAKIKAQIFPYDNLDMDHILNELSCGFIVRYEANGTAVISINNFNKHQHINEHEVASILPAQPVNVGASTNKHMQADAKIPISSLLVASSSLLVANTTDRAQRAVSPKVKQDTGLQMVVKAYKRAKGIDPNDAAWNKANYTRYVKAAKKLLDAFNDDDKSAVAYLLGKAYDWNEKELSWNLDTVAAHSWDDRGKNGQTEYNTGIPGKLGDLPPALGTDSVLDGKGNPRITQAGAVADETLRIIGGHRPKPA